MQRIGNAPILLKAGEIIMPFTQVTKEQFYSYVGPRDILVQNIRFKESRFAFSDFTTRSGVVVGKTMTDMNCQRGTEYQLRNDLIGA